MKSSTLTSSIAVALSVSSFATASAAVPPAQSFGNLSYPANGGTQIGWTWPGSGQSDNSNFLFTNTNIGSGGTDSWLTIGLRANAYYGAPNAIPTYVGNNTFQVDAGSSLWAPASGDPTPPGYANAPRWGFSWNISVNGSRDASSLNGLYWSMRIVGPNGTGNWGSLSSGAAVDANAALNAWQLGFNYFPLSSGATPINPQNPGQGFLPTGLWDGLNFNPNTVGDYQFTIAVRQSASGPIVGSTTMTVSVVPSPGAIALLGVAGLASRRRRA
jgi:MYXO-CTERM domain-containing protein